MKKLMVALAVVAMAVISQAATYNWTWSINSTSGLAKPGTDAASMTASDLVGSGTAYLFAGLSSSQLGAIVESFAAGTYSPTGYEQTSAVGTGGVITKTNWDDSRSAGTSVDWIMVVTTKIGDDDYLFISDSLTKSRQADGKNTKVTFNVLSDSATEANLASGGYAGAGWYSTGSSPAPVPEPTSGLLLLLGVAGLALKRKRA